MRNKAGLVNTPSTQVSCVRSALFHSNLFEHEVRVETHLDFDSHIFPHSGNWQLCLGISFVLLLGQVLF